MTVALYVVLVACAVIWLATFGHATQPRRRPQEPYTRVRRARGSDLATDDLHPACPRCGDLLTGDTCPHCSTSRGKPYRSKPREA